MFGKGITREVPNNEFLALVNANLPSGTNPFATIADIAGLVPITVVMIYSLLPPANPVSGQFYYVEFSEGTRWLPGSLGGTYYPSGLYYSNGVTWVTIDTPYEATQSEVNTGTNTNKFVNPETFTNASKWNTKTDIRTTSLKVANYNITNTDRNIECNGTFIVTLPLLSTITHYEDIDITNNGTGVITINTTSGEFLGNPLFNEVTIDLYSGESLTVSKGNTTYIVK